MTERIIYRDVTIQIGPEDDCESPRDGFECNLSKMICWHRKYRLGDKHNYDSPQDVYIVLFKELLSEGVVTDEQIRSVMLAVVRDEYGKEDYMDYIRDKKLGLYRKPYNKIDIRHDYLWGMDEDDMNKDDIMEKICEVVQEFYYFKDLYLYDHSGITMNTSGFACRWDSGQVGVVFTDLRKIKKEFGITDDKQAKIQASNVIEGEVSTYDQYISGDVWYYCIDDEGFEDSCGCIYGYDYCLTSAKEHIDAVYKQQEQAAKA